MKHLRRADKQFGTSRTNDGCFGTTADGTAYPSALHFTKLGFAFVCAVWTAGKTAKPLVAGLFLQGRTLRIENF